MADLIGLRVRPGACLLLVSAALAASGCTTAEAPPLSRYGQAALASGRGPIDTGTFPNLNVPQQAATQQFTAAERDARLASLRAEQQGNAPGAGETAEQRRRRIQQLADEQKETLEIIESN